VLALDSLYGCGPVFALAEQLRRSFVVTFKEGRTPALWRDYQALLPACPENALTRTWGDGRVQEFRWVPHLGYEDSDGRSWKLNALECRERAPDGTTRYFAWLTGLPVGRRTVEEVAQRGGRDRWKVEKEGFNRQKNSGLNLEHVYSTDPENWKAYYLLLQVAFLLVQLLERGSLVRRLAAEAGRPFWKLFGNLKNVARRLHDSVRYVAWEASWFDPAGARRLRIELDSSSAGRARQILRAAAASSTGFGRNHREAGAPGVRAGRGRAPRPAGPRCARHGGSLPPHRRIFIAPGGEGGKMAAVPVCRPARRAWPVCEKERRWPPPPGSCVVTRPTCGRGPRRAGRSAA
jgi:hypothetical protein